MIIIPAAVFDERGYRMGMGGGYYDRYLSAQRNQKFFLRPKKIIPAFQIQKTTHIDNFWWDIQAHYIVTEKQCYDFTN